MKIAEPMGACILAGALRARGHSVEILEPSIDGWSVARTVEEVASRASPIVGVSMLRDKHVEDVLAFVSQFRARCRDRFLVVGGHGPSIAVSAIDEGHLPPGWDRLQPDLALDVAPGTYWKPLMKSLPPYQDPVVAPERSGRGQGAATLVPDDESDMADENEDRENSPFFLSADADSPYYDKSREYLAILRFADTYMIGESDTNFPLLVERVLGRQSWRDIPGLAYLADGHLVRTPPPPKVNDLSVLPQMARDVLVRYRERYGPSVPASILASRGCYYRCTFCSVVQYERLQEGSIHRQRPNDDIVAEMRAVHDRYGVTQFNFEDDNFIVKNKAGIQKLHDLCDQLQRLEFRATFAFFCRADAVSEELFRHFRDAGCVSIYFGMESVYDGDLEFFHKGTHVADNFRALRILTALGYSPTVDAEQRILLGYITWHPLTSFASLRATSKFVREFEAPPKLLRRKLRLYSATQIVAQVAHLGLINPRHKDGWLFQDRRLEGLDKYIDAFAATVNKIRDRIRTLEKAAKAYGYDGVDATTLRTLRVSMDGMLYDYFDRAVEVADGAPEGAASPALKTFDQSARLNFDAMLAERSVLALIADGYRRCGFSDQAVDLFRK